MKRKGKGGDIFKLYASYENIFVASEISYLAINGKQAANSLDGKNVYINSTYKRNVGSW